MNQKRNIMLIGIVAMVAISLIAGINLYNKIKPSDVVMDLYEYYGVSQAESTNEAILVLEDTIMENRIILEDGEKYIEHSVINEYIDNKFYWDNNENILIYTTPTEIIKVKINSKDYTVNKTTETSDKVIVKTNGDIVYIALSFIEKYSNIEYTYFENPNRMVVRYRWDEDILFASADDDTQIRFASDKHSDILTNVKKGTELMILVNETPGTEYTKVATSDGIIGYIADNKLGESSYKKQSNDFQTTTYPSINKGYVNLAWCSVTNQNANSKVTSLLKNTQGVNVVSPTWLTVSGENGEITSLASQNVVSDIHDKGMEVWALIDDFDPNVSVASVLAHTTSRENLINNIIAEVVKFNIDGINIDFEYVTEESSKDYLQFIRELSTKCRANSIVLSVDSYVYMSYNYFYYRGEVSEVADYVVIMGYDEHHKNSEQSGSVASISWTKKAIDNSIADGVPAEKLVIGMPFYARLWTEQGGIFTDCQSLSMSEQEQVLTDNNVTATWDEETQQNYVEYTSAEKTYKMWMEDTRSIEAKLKVINAANVGGIAFWRLGQEKDDVWNTIIKYVN